MMTSASPKVQVLYHTKDRSTARRYSQELERRHIDVQQVESKQFNELLEGHISLLGVAVIMCSPRSLEESDFLLSLSAIANKFRGSDWRALLFLVEAAEVPQVLRWLPRLEVDYLGFDLAFEDLLRFVLGPLPDWLKLYCRPSQMVALTGATWWTDDIVVADEYYGHLLRVQGKDCSVLLAGLDEPYHVHLDRRMLMVTNVGGNEIICAKLQGGTLWKLWTVNSALGVKLKRPHGVFQGNDYSLIADTDNHRILWKKGHLNDNSMPWAEMHSVDVKFPCGVYGNDDGAWVVDTFNHRVLDVGLKDAVRIRAQIGGGNHDGNNLNFPVGVCSWNELLFVSEEQKKRLHLFKRKARGGQILLQDNAFAARYICSPFGVAVNRSCCALVSDRIRGCCWVIDLQKLGLLQ